MRTSIPAALPAPIALPIELLDRARLAFLRALGPLARPLVRSRELRVAVAGTIGVLIALALTGVAPLWMLALGPILLGVPHAAADVRYLVQRPGLHRRPAFWLLVVLPLAVATITVDVRWGLAAPIGAALAARGSIARRALVMVLAAVALALAWQDPWSAALVIAHAHNFVAIAFWLAWRKRRSWLHALPLGALALGCIAILAGALDPLVIALGGLEGESTGTGLWYHLATLAPGLGAPWGARLVMLFAFTQSVHYAIWVRLVPEEDRAQRTPRTFAASLRAWRVDCGTPVVALTIAIALGIAIWAIVDLAAARDGYLRGVISHGYLELAVVAWLAVERRGLRTSEWLGSSAG
ncbi:MAG: hypothetical protein M3Y87_24460 [Myxococcota bacterium]|nr:hypothetical protein [Myxococcota bacterium]